MATPSSDEWLEMLANYCARKRIEMEGPTFTHFSHEQLTMILDMSRERLGNSVRERKRIIERNTKLGRPEDKRIPELDKFIALYRDIAMKAMMSLETMEGSRT